MLSRLLKSDAPLRWAASLLGAYLRFALRTTRWTIEGETMIRRVATEGGFVVALWHESLPAVPVLWWRVQALNPQRRGAMLVSRHRDGRLLAGIMAGFGLRPLHGSSTRPGRSPKGGAPGMLAMMEALRQGEIVILTPDGPRGPRRVAAAGAAYLAARAEAPLLPVAARTAWHLRLPSWDRMEVPLPFGRGAAICLPPAAGELGDALDLAMARADLLLATRPVLAFLWHTAAAAAAPALRAMLRRRATRGKEIAERLGEREGIDTTQRPPGKLLWLHAASVGECVSILPVLEHLPAEVTTLLTTGTVTSARLLAGRLALGLETRVLHRFAPLDVPAWTARFLDHWQPDAAGFLESELWPNQLTALRKRNIPVSLLNARISERSASSWGRAPGLARHVLDHFAWIAAQSEADAGRLRALGATRVDAPGNLKSCAPPLAADPAELARLEALLCDRPRWLAASTHPGDEAMAAGIHRALAPDFPGLLTAIVPRHPERGAALAAELAAPRRSQGADPGAGLWLADTLGELGLFYRLFPIVFMGKSFAGGGGQNPLEPARLGCAIATGPDASNFADAVQQLKEAGAITIIENPAELETFLRAMLNDPLRARNAGEAARSAAEADAGLAQAIAARLAAMMPG